MKTEIETTRIEIGFVGKAAQHEAEELTLMQLNDAKSELSNLPYALAGVESAIKIINEHAALVAVAEAVKLQKNSREVLNALANLAAVRERKAAVQ